MKRFVGLEIEDWEIVLDALGIAYNARHWNPHESGRKAAEESMRVKRLIEVRLGRQPPAGASKE